MLERYRTLGAMLALREFTVADLARYSGVKQATVRTILARDSQYVVRRPVVSTGKSGGQPLTYSLRLEAVQNLVELLRTLEAVGARPPVAGSSESDDGWNGSAVPASLVAAEDALLRQLPLVCTLAERNQILRVAATDFETARLTVQNPEREVAAHFEVVDFMLRLSRAEQDILSSAMIAEEKAEALSFFEVPFGSPENEEKLSELRRDLHRVLTEMPELQDRRLLPDLFDRVGTSPFAQVLRQVPGASEINSAPHVLLCDAGGPGTAYISDFVTDVLRRQEVPFSIVSPTFWEKAPESDWDSRQSGIAYASSPFTAILMTVRAGDAFGLDAVSHACGMYGQLRKFVVLCNHFDSDLYNRVNSLQGRYLSFQGLEENGLLGALGAAMTDASFAPLNGPRSVPPPMSPSPLMQLGVTFGDSRSSKK